MSGTEPTAAEIEAATVAIMQGGQEDRDLARYDARAALAAALPLVVARVRADIADEIEAIRDSDEDTHYEHCSLTQAAHIVRHPARVARGTGELQ